MSTFYSSTPADTFLTTKEIKPMIKISFDIIRSNNLNVNTELIFYHWEKTLNNRVDFEFLF